MTLPVAQPGAPLVAAKALRRAADVLQLSQAEVAGIVGASAASVSRTFAGERGLDVQSAEGRLALLFLRVFRSLDALVGGDAAKARLWLRADNRHLGAAPLSLLALPQGLVRVADYLDAFRGRL
ncbi:MAG TPA: MbcA/ParS/Xre antitoxin family protein [Myxococcales bacterium]|nr:MbcA/ParS/Xre antitoxin family protein [Myxococcales bacterium]